MSIEALRDFCSNARIELDGDYGLGLRDYKQAQDAADLAMIAALALEQNILKG